MTEFVNPGQRMMLILPYCPPAQSRAAIEREGERGKAEGAGGVDERYKMIDKRDS